MFERLRQLCSRLYNVVRRKKENRSRITVDMSTVGRGFESHASETHGTHCILGARSRVQIPAATPSLEQVIREEWLPRPKRPLRHGRPGSRRRPKSNAVHKDISRFMRGSKHQHKWYRRSVRVRVEPEED